MCKGMLLGDIKCGVMLLGDGFLLADVTCEGFLLSGAK